LSEEKESVEKDSKSEDCDVNIRENFVVFPNSPVFDENLRVNGEDGDVERETEDDDESRIVFGKFERDCLLLFSS